MHDRIVLHLAQYSRYREQFECPKEISQSGIAEALGISRAHAALELKKLKEKEEEVEERLAHIKGGKTRRKVYFLTFKGRVEGERLKKFVLKKKMTLRDLNGKIQQLDGAAAMEYLKKDVGITENRALLCLSLDEIDCKKIQIDKEEGIEIAIPKIRYFYGRRAELTKLKLWLSPQDTHRFAMIIGLPGIGKTTLAAKLAMEHDAEVFWYKIYPIDTIDTIIKALSKFLSEHRKNRLKTYLYSMKNIDMHEIVRILEKDLKNENALFVFDDFHCADPAISDFFSLLLTTLEKCSGIKFLLTSKESIKFYSRGDVLIKNIVGEMILNGLDKEASLELLNDRSGYEFNSFAKNSAYKLTGGHPLALELIQPGTADQKEVRRYVYEEIAANISEEERNLLGMVSVFRCPFSSKALDLDSELFRSLVIKSLLKEVNGKYDTHELIRKFFYDKLPPKIKKENHSRAADHYLREEDMFERLYHLIKAGRKIEAVRLVIKYGRNFIKCKNLMDLKSMLDELVPRKEEHIIEILFLKREVANILGECDEDAVNVKNELSILNEKCYYDTTARGYDELHREEQLNKLNIIEKNISVKNNDLMLDVGCGPCFSTEIFKCKVIGMDPSIKMLAQAKNGSFVMGEAEHLPFKDRCFDVVISVTAIHNFDDVKKALLEIRRASNGRIVLTVLKKSKRIDEIKSLICKLFFVKRVVEEDKDLIFII